jgi:hemolysin III
VAVFQLKQIRNPSTGDPIHWTYDRAEVIADGVVHFAGVSLGMIAIALCIFQLASGTDRYDVVVYTIVLAAMLGLSAAYNLWPVSPRKWLLRRFDHAVIYLLIAATYTPFISEVRHDRNIVIVFLVGVWSTALTGAVLKLFFPGRFDRLSIGLYLAMGWSGIILYEKAVSALPVSTLILIATGGTLYTFGVLFHTWERLRFQNAIWHAFVLLAAGCHFVAVVGLEFA